MCLVDVVQQNFGQNCEKNPCLQISLMMQILNSWQDVWRSLEVPEHPARNTSVFIDSEALKLHLIYGSWLICCEQKEYSGYMVMSSCTKA